MKRMTQLPADTRRDTSLSTTTAQQQMLAWGVHAFTASGVVIGFLALQAIFVGDARLAFIWMAVATLIDALDGMLARKAQVKAILPQFDGARLDDIIDYFTFAIVPIVFLDHFQLLPAGATLVFVAAPLVASAYGFCQAAAKTEEHYFTGFPSYWNIIAFYLYAGHTPVWFNGLIIGGLAVMVFVPIRYVYPSRTVRLRWLSNSLGGVWGIMLLVIVWQLPDPAPGLVLGSLVYPVYYTALSLYLHTTTS
jgi:phosphatidylcholine synthase